MAQGARSHAHRMLAPFTGPEPDPPHPPRPRRQKIRRPGGFVARPRKIQHHVAARHPLVPTAAPPARRPQPRHHPISLAPVAARTLRAGWGRPLATVLQTNGKKYQLLSRHAPLSGGGALSAHDSTAAPYGACCAAPLYNVESLETSSSAKHADELSSPGAPRASFRSHDRHDRTRGPGSRQFGAASSGVAEVSGVG